MHTSPKNRLIIVEIMLGLDTPKLLNPLVTLYKRHLSFGDLGRICTTVTWSPSMVTGWQ